MSETGCVDRREVLDWLPRERVDATRIRLLAPRRRFLDLAWLDDGVTAAGGFATELRAGAAPLAALSAGPVTVEATACPWQPMAHGPTDRVLWPVCDFGSGTPFAVGESGPVLRCDGDTWTCMAVPNTLIRTAIGEACPGTSTRWDSSGSVRRSEAWGAAPRA